MSGFAMSPGENSQELTVLREKIADLQLELARQKQRVSASEARFLRLADTAPVMMWMSGSDGGKSTKEAAMALRISYKTADSHRSRILEKLGIHETASMVRYAIRSGLIEA